VTFAIGVERRIVSQATAPPTAQIPAQISIAC
jgi:hypothetical protein